MGLGLDRFVESFAVRNVGCTTRNSMGTTVCFGFGSVGTTAAKLIERFRRFHLFAVCCFMTTVRSPFVIRAGSR